MIRNWLENDNGRRLTAALSRWSSPKPGGRRSSEPPPALPREGELARPRTVGLVSDRAGCEGTIAPDGTPVRRIAPQTLGALEEGRELPRALVIDLRGPAEARRAVIRRLADVPSVGRVWVGLVDEAEGAADAARWGVGAILRSSEESALAEAVVVCHALGERATPSYASLEQTYRRLDEAHTRLLARSSDASARQAMIVHDLRSPLSVLRGALTELCVDVTPNTEAHSLLSMVDRAARQLTELVDRLEQLFGSSPEPVRRERVDLAALARGVAGGLRYSPESQGKALHVCAPDALHLSADRQDLVRVLTNLVGNALRHARSRVEVEVGGADEEVRVLVRDNGPGIPPALLGRVFQRFVRNPGAGRMGLGLAIVQQAVERHGGSVDAHNRSEREGPSVQGACFVVRLPMSGER